MSDNLRSQIQSLLSQADAAATPAAGSGGGGIDYDQLASALTRQQRQAPAAPERPPSLAELIAERSRPTNRTSVSDAGSPAPSSHGFHDSTPLIQMSESDRAHFIATRGLAAYAARLRQEMRNTRISLRRR